MKSKLLAWFSKAIIGAITISRNGHKTNQDPLAPCYEALDKNQILIFFPEGARGHPEQLATFKKGIAYFGERYTQVPIIPIFIHGLGKALPKGELILVPFFCDIFVGNPIEWRDDKTIFMEALNDEFKILAAEGGFKSWQ